MSSDPEPPFLLHQRRSFLRRSHAGRPLLDELSAIRASLVLLCAAVLLLGFSVLLAYRRVALGFWDANVCVGFVPSACQNGLSALGAVTSLLGLALAAVGGVLAGWTALDVHGRSRGLAWGTAGASAVIVVAFVTWAILLEL